MYAYLTFTHVRGSTEVVSSLRNSDRREPRIVISAVRFTLNRIEARYGASSVSAQQSQSVPIHNMMFCNFRFWNL